MDKKNKTVAKHELIGSGLVGDDYLLHLAQFSIDSEEVSIQLALDAQ